MRMLGNVGWMVLACLQVAGCSRGTEVGPEPVEIVQQRAAVMPTHVIASVTGDGASVARVEEPYFGWTSTYTVLGQRSYNIAETYGPGYRPRAPRPLHRLPESMVWTDPTNAPAACLGGHGPNCLIFLGYGARNVADAAPWLDRLELELESSDAGCPGNWGGPCNALTLGGRRYLRFYVMISSETEHRPDLRQADVLISQVWQDGQSHGGPPFQINLQRGDDADHVKLFFSYRNDLNFSLDDDTKDSFYEGRDVNPQSANAGAEFATVTLLKDTWYNFHIDLKPVPVPTDGVPVDKGHVRIYLNQGFNFNFPSDAQFDPAQLVAGQTQHSFYWGYRENTGTCGPDHHYCRVVPRFSTRVGLYRNSSVGAREMGRSVMYMDSLKLTDAGNLMSGW
jgi:hypothetical protein